MGKNTQVGIEVVDGFTGKKAIVPDIDVANAIGDHQQYRGKVEVRTNIELVSEVQRVYGHSPETDGHDTIALWKLIFSRAGLNVSDNVFQQYTKAHVDNHAVEVATSKAKRASEKALKAQLSQTNAIEMAIALALMNGHNAGQTDKQIYEQLAKQNIEKSLLNKHFPSLK